MVAWICLKHKRISTFFFQLGTMFHPTGCDTSANQMRDPISDQIRRDFSSECDILPTGCDIHCQPGAIGRALGGP